MDERWKQFNNQPIGQEEANGLIQGLKYTTPQNLEAMFTNFPILARFRQCFVDAAGHWYGYQDRRKQEGLNFMFQELASNQEVLQANQEALQALKQSTSR